MNTLVGERDFYDDLDLSLNKAWAVIEPGALKRASPAHTPVVATIGLDGFPQQRVMVLRAANRDKRLLRFHTDIRSDKIKQKGPASVLMYDAAEKVQLRLAGQITVQSEGAEVDAAWRDSTTFARRCYMAHTAPGSIAAEPNSGLPGWIEGQQPSEQQLTEYRPNFALLWLSVTTIEWLYLANSGHRRAKWIWNDSALLWSGCWLVP